jgi:hypothetical protein
LPCGGSDGLIAWLCSGPSTGCQRHLVGAPGQDQLQSHCAWYALGWICRALGREERPLQELRVLARLADAQESEAYQCSVEVTVRIFGLQQDQARELQRLLPDMLDVPSGAIVATNIAVQPTGEGKAPPGDVYEEVHLARCIVVRNYGMRRDSSAVWAEGIYRRLDTVVRHIQFTDELRKRLPRSVLLQDAQVLIRDSDGSRRDLRASDAGDFDVTTVLRAAHRWTGVEPERVQTWVTDFAKPPMCPECNSERRMLYRRSWSHRGLQCRRCEQPVGQYLWTCTCGTHICLHCSPHERKRPLADTLKDAVVASRAFLVCTGNVRWENFDHRTPPLDNPNPVSNHWFAVLRRDDQWYWFDTKRRHRTVTDTTRLLLRATENGMLFSFPNVGPLGLPPLQPLLAAQPPALPAAPPPLGARPAEAPAARELDVHVVTRACKHIRALLSVSNSSLVAAPGKETDDAEAWDTCTLCFGDS